MRPFLKGELQLLCAKMINVKPQNNIHAVRRPLPFQYHGKEPPRGPGLGFRAKGIPTLNP